MPKVGYLESEDVLPLVGPNPFNSAADNDSGLTLNLEVYQTQDGSVTCIQQRAPFVQVRSCFVSDGY